MLRASKEATESSVGVPMAAPSERESRLKSIIGSGNHANDPLPFQFSNSTPPSSTPLPYSPDSLFSSPPLYRSPRRRRKPPKAFSCCFTSFIDHKLEEDSISSLRRKRVWSFRKKFRDRNVVVEDKPDTVPEQNQTIHTSVTTEIIAEEEESGGGSRTAPFDAQSNSLAAVPNGKIETISEQDQSGGGSTTPAVSDTHVQTNPVAVVTDDRAERIPEHDQSNSLAVVPDATTESIPEEDKSSGDSKTVLLNGHIQSNSLAVVPYGDKQISADESELQTLGNKAAEELRIRSKFGETYEAITVDVGRIKKRLKDLSVNVNKEGETTKNINTIDEGIEISDAASFLKLSRASSSEIEMAGLKAQRAAVLMFQAQVMTTKAIQLLAESKHMLQSAEI